MRGSKVMDDGCECYSALEYTGGCSQKEKVTALMLTGGGGLIK